jgi:hypothetical protein
MHETSIGGGNKQALSQNNVPEKVFWASNDHYRDINCIYKSLLRLVFCSHVFACFCFHVFSEVYISVKHFTFWLNLTPGSVVWVDLETRGAIHQLFSIIFKLRILVLLPASNLPYVAQCLIADADTSKFWISLYKANGNI